MKFVKVFSLESFPLYSTIQERNGLARQTIKCSVVSLGGGGGCMWVNLSQCTHPLHARQLLLFNT